MGSPTSSSSCSSPAGRCCRGNAPPRRGRRGVQAGGPPDAFSATGQRWGNPLYRWELMERGGYRWWLDRLAMAARRFALSHSATLEDATLLAQYRTVLGRDLREGTECAA